MKTRTILPLPFLLSMGFAVSAQVEQGRLPLVTHLEGQATAVAPLKAPILKVPASKAADCAPGKSGRAEVKPALVAGVKEELCTIPLAGAAPAADSKSRTQKR